MPSQKFSDHAAIGVEAAAHVCADVDADCLSLEEIRLGEGR
jgi:hypothetical protein